jgi:hypothetical protein
MKNRDSSIIYFLLGLYALIINWEKNHNLISLLLAWIFWPLYLIYEIFTGGLSHGLWKEIPQEFFRHYFGG